jgi:hypothetical protein
VAVRGCHEYRHYLGVDARWKAGILFFNPTVIYTTGKRDIVNAVDGLRYKQDTQGWYVDLEGGVTMGPLTVPVVLVYTPGNKAKTNIGNRAGKPQDVKYYQSLDVDGAYGSGRISEVIANNSIDYIKGYALSTSINKNVMGYDRYGAIDVAVRPKYAVTPAVTLTGFVASHWAAEKVDTNAGFNANTGLVPAPDGQQRTKTYLGSEVAAFLTYAFAPGITFDVGSGIFFPGEGMERCDTSESTGAATAVGTGGCPQGSRDLKNAYWGAARVRYQF